jgi:hypothetical protein
MNQKLAKTLRRMAKDAHATLDETTKAPLHDKDPSRQVYLREQQRGFRFCHPRSVRGIYRRIKKESSVRSFAREIIIEQRKLRQLQKLSQEGRLQ